MGRNKKRIYMALYARSGPQGHIPHVAILISPKNPDRQSRTTWRLHAVNRPNPEAFAVTQQEWHYQANTVSGRTSRLIALALLGKTERSGEEVATILNEAEIIQDDPSWNCKSWVFGAIQVLIAQEIITKPAVELEELYGSTLQLADSFRQIAADERAKLPVPTCDNSGATITSEVN